MWCNGSFVFKLAVCLAGVVKSDLKPTGVGFQASQTSPYRDPDSAIGFRVKREYIGSDHRVSAGAPSQSRDLTLGSDMSKLWSSLKFEDEVQSAAWEEYSKAVKKKEGAISTEPEPEVIQEPVPEVIQEPEPEVIQEPVPEVIQEPEPEVIQ